MKKDKKSLMLAFVFTSLIIILSSQSFGMINPSAAYCNELGYNYKTKETDEGTLGVCILPNGNEVNAWDFYDCKVGKTFSYCSKEGYEITRENDTCFCELPNGTKMKEKELMDMDLTPGECGDNICQMGENYNNCPEDCTSGSRDGYCDGVEDGICDPDCEIDQDPDCKEEICNQNGICEPERGENYKNCSEDCPSGSEEGYCDGIKDGICDADCAPEEDPDCEEETGNCNQNGECEPDKGENYKNCPQDCSSGIQDGYCDGLEDGTCDPDCEIDQDPDCEEQELEIPLWAYIVIGGVVLFIIFVLFTSMKVEK